MQQQAKVVDAKVTSMENAVPSVLVLKFRLEHAETRYGESILVVGSCPELGSWKLEEGVRLDTCEYAYPEWQSQEVSFNLPSLACRSLTFRYKYVTDRHAFGEASLWEDSIEDREVTIPIEIDGVVEIRDGHFDVHSPPQISHLRKPKKGILPKASKGCSLSAVDTPPLAAHARARAESLGHENAENALNIEKVSFHNSYDLLGDGPIASGGFSRVWRCTRHGNVGAVRAVKIVNLDELSQRGRRFLFGHKNRHGEIQLHQSLCHPHIVELVEVFHDPGVASLVMEYCPGGDLLEIVLHHRELHKTGLPEDGAARVMAHLCQALAYLHENCIVHRDVKCENVLQLEARGTPLDVATFKLGDLGLAARLLKDQVLLEQVGSPSTSAPEVILGRPHAMPADMWSAGATLFTMLAARRPYDSAANTLGNISLQGGCWENISESARSLVEQLLHSDALLRISAQAALQHPWLRTRRS